MFRVIKAHAHTHAYAHTHVTINLYNNLTSALNLAEALFARVTIGVYFKATPQFQLQWNATCWVSQLSIAILYNATGTWVMFPLFIALLITIIIPKHNLISIVHNTWFRM